MKNITSTICFIDDVIELVISYLSIADINLNRWSLLILNIAPQK
ncbi:hypothetical protein [Escherichia coli]